MNPRNYKYHLVRVKRAARRLWTNHKFLIMFGAVVCLLIINASQP